MSTGNSIPVAIAAAANQTLPVGQSVAAAALFNASDADDAIVQYQLWDSGTDPTSGHFAIGGIAQPANQAIALGAADLANTQWLAGNSNGIETVWVRAYDGSDWSAWASWTMTSRNAAPAVTVQNIAATVAQPVAASSFVSATDPDHGAIAWYELWDGGATGGYFSVNGARQGSNQDIIVRPADLAHTSYVGGHSAGSETLWARAYDGADWGEWKSFTATTQGPANHAPVVVAGASRVGTGEALPGALLFSASDADGDPVVRYELMDDGDKFENTLTFAAITQWPGTIFNAGSIDLSGSFSSPAFQSLMITADQ